MAEHKTTKFCGIVYKVPGSGTYYALRHTDAVEDFKARVTNINRETRFVEVPIDSIDSAKNFLTRAEESLCKRQCQGE